MLNDRNIGARTLNALYTYRDIGPEEQGWQRDGRTFIYALYNDGTFECEDFHYAPNAATRRASSYLESFGGGCPLRMARETPFLAVNPFKLVDVTLDNTDCVLHFRNTCATATIAHYSEMDAHSLQRIVQRKFLLSKQAYAYPLCSGQVVDFAAARGV